MQAGLPDSALFAGFAFPAQRTLLPSAEFILPKSVVHGCNLRLKHPKLYLLRLLNIRISRFSCGMKVLFGIMNNCAHKSGNLTRNGPFRGRHRLPKLTQEEIASLDMLVSTKGIKSIIIFK